MTVRGEAAESSRYRFGAFEADLRTGELFRDGERVKIADQPLQVLALLVERAGELVTRKELCERLWPDETYVDFDRGLNTAVRTLRRTLKDSSRNPTFIETFPKRGYRFIADVETVSASETQQSHANGESPQRNTASLAKRSPFVFWGAVTAIGFVLFGLFALDTFNESAPPVRADERVGALPGGLDHVWGAISPNGEYLVRRDGDSGFLYLLDLAAEQERVLLEEPIERAMVWSPDSLQVAYLRAREGEHWIEAVEIGSGKTRALLNLGPVPPVPRVKIPVAWDASRQRLLLADWQGNWLGFLSLESREVEKLEVSDELVTRDVSLSPNGRFLASSTPANDIVVLPVSGAAETITVTATDDTESHPVWARDGRTLFFCRMVGEHRGNPEVWAVKVDPQAGVLVGDPVRLTEIPDPRFTFRPVVTDGGEFLWAKQQPGNSVRILEVDPSTGEPSGEALNELPRGYWGGIWTAEGSILRVNSNLDWPVPGKTVFRKIDIESGDESLMEVKKFQGRVSYSADLTKATVVRKTSQGGSTVLLADMETDEVTEVLSSPVRFWSTAISPNARLIAFLETRFLPGKAGGIGVVDVESKAVRRLYEGQRMEGPVWSPDGSEIAFVDQPCILILNVESGESEELSCYSEPQLEGKGVRPASPHWSPDGKMLVWAAVNAAERRHEVWVIDRATGSHRVIWTGETDYQTEAWAPSWSADGRYLAFAFMDKPPVEVWRVRHPLISGSSSTFSD